MRTFVLYILLAAGAMGQSALSIGGWERDRSKEPPGSISGSLIDTVTKSPIPGARIALLIQGNGGSDKFCSTTEDGRFQFAGVIPGHYYLEPSHNDYPGPLNGQHFGVHVEVQPGKETAGVQIGMIPPATASGSILNDDGEPVRNCTVLLLPVGPQDRGLRPPLLGFSNDRGQFRINNISPDRYHAFARCQDILPTEHLLDIVPPTGFETRSMWRPVYYPASSTLADAQEFPVAAGLDPNLEFRLQATPVSTLKGSLSVAPGANWQNPPMIQLRELGDEQPELFRAHLGAIDKARGLFTIRAVRPGNYQLIATVQDNASTPQGSAVIPVSVGTADPPAIPLVLQPGVPLRGVVEAPSGRYPARASYTIVTEGNITRTQKQSPGQLRLESIGTGQYLNTLTAAVDAENGAFAFPAVAPGRWKVIYSSTAGTDYVESLQFSDKRVYGNEIEIAPGSSPSLRLQLAPRPQVTFDLVNVPVEPISRWMIMAVDEQETATEFSEYVAQGKPGEIATITQLPPGRYRLIALELGFAVSRTRDRSRLLRMLARHIDPVEITASGQQSVAVRCLSSEQVRKLLTTYLYGDTPPPSAP